MSSQPPLSLEKLPEQAKTIYLWADYIELLSLSNVDQEISGADLLDRIQERQDLSDAEIDDNNIQRDDENSSNQQDKYTRRMHDWFKHLKIRQDVLGDRYPFIVEGNICKVNPSVDLYWCNLYSFLLYCSNLRVLTNRAQITILTSIFEMVCLEALKSYMPKSALTYLFGANSKYEPQYAGNLWQRISALADDLKEDLVCKEEEILQSGGDRGLDIVSWVPFCDGCQTKLLVFGQCASSPTEWTQKQHEAGQSRWGNYINFHSPLTSMIFVPLFFRNNFAQWEDKFLIENSILIDRYRLMELLTDHKLPSVIFSDIEETISALLDYKESIF